MKSNKINKYLKGRGRVKGLNNLYLSDPRAKNVDKRAIVPVIITAKLQWSTTNDIINDIWHSNR